VAELEVRTTLLAVDEKVHVRVDIGGTEKAVPLGRQLSRAAVDAEARRLAGLILDDLEAADERRTQERRHARQCMAALRAHLGADNGNGPSEDDDE
jgi:hypothetical protein|tara:strand:+ start:3837 stop:4124 length:288 start_codon:yes stop_codon:yes gene_type:complete